RRIRRAQRFGESLGDPSLGRHFVLYRQINGAASWTNPEVRNVFAHRFDSVGDLVFRTLLQFVQKPVAHSRGIKARRTEVIERDIPLAQGEQLTLPCLGNRAFLGQEWPRPELKSNRTEFGIADPIAPFAQ